MTTRVFTHNHPVTPGMRASQKGHAPLLLWFTGLSASGKSTVAGLLEQRLHDHGVHTILLDGDNVRSGLNQDLGLSPSDRKENIRRIGEVAGLFLDAGLVTLCAFISPYRAERNALQEKFQNRFVEIHVSTPLEVCRTRDPKGLYARAEQGVLTGMTALDAPYEPPENPDLTIDTSTRSPEACAGLLLSQILPMLKRQP